MTTSNTSDTFFIAFSHNAINQTSNYSLMSNYRDKLNSKYFKIEDDTEQNLARSESANEQIHSNLGSDIADSDVTNLSDLSIDLTAEDDYALLCNICKNVPLIERYYRWIEFH